MLRVDTEEPIFFHGVRIIWDSELPPDQKIIWPERCKCVECSEYLKRKMEETEMTWQAIKSTVIEMYFSDQIEKSEKLGFIEYLKTIVDTGKGWTRGKQMKLDDR